MAPDKIDRRQFIRRAGVWCLAGMTATGAAVLLEGCGSGEKVEKKAEEIGGKPKEIIDTAAEGVDPCGDVSALSEPELEIRKNFEYAPRSEVEGQKCSNCQFWIAPTGATPCGTCTIVKGPINPNGHCISWAEKTT